MDAGKLNISARQDTVAEVYKKYFCVYVLECRSVVYCSMQIPHKLYIYIYIYIYIYMDGSVLATQGIGGLHNNPIPTSLYLNGMSI